LDVWFVKRVADRTDYQGLGRREIYIDSQLWITRVSPCIRLAGAGLRLPSIAGRLIEHANTPPHPEGLEQPASSHL
jgi:hypothetical protein